MKIFMVNQTTIYLSKQLGTLLKSYRKSKNISQVDFAQKVGICQSRVSYLENHPEDMSFDQLMRWVSVLGLEIRLAVKQKDKVDTEW